MKIGPPLVGRPSTTLVHALYCGRTRVGGVTELLVSTGVTKRLLSSGAVTFFAGVGGSAGLSGGAGSCPGGAALASGSSCTGVALGSGTESATAATTESRASSICPRTTSAGMFAGIGRGRHSITPVPPVGSVAWAAALAAPNVATAIHSKVVRKHRIVQTLKERNLASRRRGRGAAQGRAGK